MCLDEYIRLWEFNCYWSEEENRLIEWYRNIETDECIDVYEYYDTYEYLKYKE